MSRKSRFKASGSNDVWFAGACLVAIIVFGLSSHADAQESTAPEVAFNVAIGSDYVFRGVSQTEQDPALSGGMDVTFGDLYLGGWASNVSYAGDEETDAEVDVYGGYRTEIAGFAVDVGGIAYLYAGQPDGADYDYVEAKLAVSRAFGPATVGGAVYYSPDFFGPSEDQTTYVEANAAFSPIDKVTISGAVGRQFVSSDFDYTTWNAGVAYQLTDNLVLDGRYHDTDEPGFGAVYEDRAVVSIKAVF